jgi:hypothetical protein
MRYRRRSVSYAGQAFSFERLNPRSGEKSRVTWAVSRRGEFIGTMTCTEEVTTSEFDVRCTAWLQDLLGTRSLPL